MPRIEKQAGAGKAVGARAAVVASKTGNAVSRIKPMNFDPNEGIKIMLYGESGTGKTTCWGSFPGKLLALICSGGKRPGELRSLNTPENKKRIDTVTIQTPGEILELAEYAESSGKYQGVIMDHCTGVADMVLAKILGLDPKDLPEQKSWGLATRQQYGQQTAQCKELFKALLGLSCNVVMIAQERIFNNKSDSDESVDELPESFGSELMIKPKVGAAMGPALTGWLNTAVDYICQTHLRQRVETVTTKLGGKDVATTKKVQGVEYCLRVAPDVLFTTKFRQPKGYKLPEVIVDPTYEKIIKHIQGR